MKPIAWYDPTNGMVSTDKDSPLFTPLGQVWPLYLPHTWTDLTRNEILELLNAFYTEEFSSEREIAFARVIQKAIKEKNT